MIRYALHCAEGHRFDSWFDSSEAFDRLREARMLTCPECGSAEVQKALMAPGVRQDGPRIPPAIAAKLAEIRHKVTTEGENVGRGFAAEARKIHQGDAPDRLIYGEAKPEEAKALVDDGIPVAPLPPAPPKTALN